MLIASAVSALHYSLHLLLKFASPGPFLLLVTASLIVALIHNHCRPLSRFCTGPQ